MFESQNAIEEMRNNIGKGNNLSNVYKEVASPSQQSMQSYFSPSNSQIFANKSQLLNNDQQRYGLNHVWKSNGLLIITMIMRFLYSLKLQTESMKYKLLTERIFTIIQDISSDYLNLVRYRNNRFQMRGRSNLKVHYSLFRKQMRAALELYGSYIPTFYPDQKFIVGFQFSLIISILINLFYVPINISFLNEEISVTFELVPEIFQITWIFIQLNLSFYKDQILVRSRVEIASHYVKSYFVFDFLIVLSIQFQLVFDYAPVLSFILRIPQLIRILDQFEYNTNFKEKVAAVFDLSKLIIMLIFIIHCCACSWHFLGVYEKESLRQQNWLDHYQISEDWVQQYIASLYFSVITTLTVGYGDITPQSSQEQLFVILVAMSLCGMLGYTITNIGEIYRSMNEKKQQYKSQMKAIEQIIRQRKLNDKLAIKVKKYYQHLFLQEQGENLLGEQLLTKLTRNLEEEVMIDTYKSTLMKSYLLRQFKESTVEYLCAKVRIQKHQPGDEVVKTQQFADQLIFLINGELTLLGHNQRQPIALKQLLPGTVIGEQEFTEQGYYDYMILSQGYSKIATIPRSAFYEVLQYDRQEFEKMCRIRDQYKFSVKRRNVIGRTCEICGWTHGYLQCPMTFYQVDKVKLLTQYSKNIIQERLYQDYRRNKKWNTLNGLSQTQNACVDFMISQKLLDDILPEQNEDGTQKLFLNIQDCSSSQISSSRSLQSSQSMSKKVVSKSPKNMSRFSFLNKQVNEKDQIRRLTFARTDNKKQSIIIENPVRRDEDLKGYIDELLLKLSCHQKEREKSLIQNSTKVGYDPDLEFEVMQSYKYYFPHFNIDNIIQRLNVNYEKYLQKSRKTIRMFVTRRKVRQRVMIQD